MNLQWTVIKICDDFRSQTADKYVKYSSDWGLSSQKVYLKSALFLFFYFFKKRQFYFNFQDDAETKLMLSNRAGTSTRVPKVRVG